MREHLGARLLRRRRASLGRSCVLAKPARVAFAIRRAMRYQLRDTWRARGRRDVRTSVRPRPGVPGSPCRKWRCSPHARLVAERAAIHGVVRHEGSLDGASCVRASADPRGTAGRSQYRWLRPRPDLDAPRPPRTQARRPGVKPAPSGHLRARSRLLRVPDRHGAFELPGRLRGAGRVTPSLGPLRSGKDRLAWARPYGVPGASLVSWRGLPSGSARR